MNSITRYAVRPAVRAQTPPVDRCVGNSAAQSLHAGHRSHRSLLGKLHLRGWRLFHQRQDTIAADGQGGVARVLLNFERAKGEAISQQRGQHGKASGCRSEGTRKDCVVGTGVLLSVPPSLLKLASVRLDICRRVHHIAAVRRGESDAMDHAVAVQEAHVGSCPVGTDP